MIFLIKKKKILTIITSIISVVIMMLIFSNHSVVLAMSNKSSKKVPIYKVDRQDNKIALTFDAAWGADKTEKILQILTKHNVSATFFLVDFWIDENIELVKKMDNMGIEIGNHSLTHLDMTKLTKVQKEHEIKVVNEKLKKVTNKAVKFFRFPFGAYDYECMKCVEKEGLIPIQWDVDSLDWKGLNKEQILMRIKENVKSGSIILFHNNSEHILEALEDVICYLKSKSFEMVNMSKLVYFENYYIDNNGIQHNNSI